MIQEIFREAIQLAHKASASGEVPVGALVVKEGKIIARAHNEKEQRKDTTAHAEILALREASRVLGNWRLSGCELVVTLEPCPMCLAACQQSRIDRVVYGAVDPKGGAFSLGYSIHQDARLNHQFELKFVDVPQAGEVLKDFFKKKRK